MPVGVAPCSLHANQNHVALQKLRRNHSLTPTDLGELERMPVEAGVGTAEDLERAREQSEGLGLFIRGLVGLEREAATSAMNAFTSGRTLTASQLDFLDLVVAELTEHGAMNPGRLYGFPFTGLAPQGPGVAVQRLRARLAREGSPRRVGRWRHVIRGRRSGRRPAKTVVGAP